MAPAAASTSASSKALWRPTKVMNMHDLSRDDDFLSHLLVEKLGTGDVPLVVHKMDPTRKVPKTNAEELLDIVRRMVAAKGSQQTIIKQAVDDLLTLNGVKYYLKCSNYDQKQINAFATHASRYFELYLPNGSIEISHTSRYSHRTGKSELCILATRPLAPGTVISELKGSMADLTEEEDKELKRTGERHADGVGIRRDFSVIHSKQLKKNHLFLGPARFVNHDCDHNVELFREGRYITFRVIKPIGVGEEVTAHYGDGYFGRKNRHCLCATCERNNRGGYAPQGSDEDLSDAGSGSGGEEHVDEESSSQSSDSDAESDAETVNCNERRTRRGVYAVMPEAAGGGSMELNKEADAEAASDLTSLPTPLSSASQAVNDHGLMTPEPEGQRRGRAPFKGKDRETLSAPIAPVPRKPTPSTSASLPYRSVISTRAQKAREASREASTSAATSRAASKTVKGRSVSAARQLVTPPLTVDSAATSVRSSSRLRSAGDTISSLTESSRVSTPVKDKKGKGRATASVSDVRDIETHEPEARHLRPRVSATIFEHKLSKKKLDDAPRGLDGKPLPMCSTCANILPVISVDSEIVWGLSVGRTGKRGRPKKDAATECPRCLRHFAIYGRKWPERVPGDGSRVYIPVPQLLAAQAKKITPSALAAVNRKLVGTSASAHKRHAEPVEEEDPRPAKKTKAVKVAKGPVGRPRQTKVNMSATARQILNATSGDGRRSGRTRVPSLKVRENDPDPPATGRVSSRLYPPSSPSQPHTDHRDPPPSLPVTPTTPTSGSPASPKAVTPKSLAVASQPRDANGRFGKKAATNGRFMRKTFAVRKRPLLGHMMQPRPTSIKTMLTQALSDDEDGDEDGDELGLYEDVLSDELYSDMTEGVEFGEEALEDVVLKRNSESDLDDSPRRKKIRITDSDASDVSPTTSPRFVMGRGSLLRPNPISFARRKWAMEEEQTSGGVTTKTRVSVETTVEVDGPSKLGPAAVITSRHTEIEVEEVNAQETLNDSPSGASARYLAPAARAARLTFKPSPMNLAKRRWGGPVASESTRTTSSSLRNEVEPAHDEDRPSDSASAVRRSTTDLLGGLAYPDYGPSDDYYTSDEDDEYTSEDSEEPAAPTLTVAMSQVGLRPSAPGYAKAVDYSGYPIGYPKHRATSPIYRPTSFTLSRASTPRRDADGNSASPLTSPGSSLDDSPHHRPLAGTSDVRSFSLSRITTPGLTAPGDSTDDSERVVERLIGMDSTATTSAGSSASPSMAGTPESPPGYHWKRTVLIPTALATNRPFPTPEYPKDAHARVSAVSAASSRAGYPLSLSSMLSFPANIPSTPPPLAMPVARSPVKLTSAGWDTCSDTDSP